MQLWDQRYNKQGAIELFAKPRDPSVSTESYWNIFKLNLIENTTSPYPVIFSGAPATANYALRISNDFSLIIHTTQSKWGDIDTLFKELQLVRNEEISSIKVILHETHKPVIEARESIGERIRGPEFVDPIQLALDVSHFGARGVEHAEKVYSKILYPFWTKKGWSL
jgi:hypothetical protein